MPVYNERATIERAIESVLEAAPGDSFEVLIVDDGSTDGTRDILRGRSWPDNVRVLLESRNRGKGAAVRAGLSEARGRWTTILDADLEYSADDIELLLVPLRDGERAVFGVRGFQSHSAYSFWYVAGNLFVTFLTNILFNCWVSDVMTGHKAIETELFRSLQLRERGFAIEPEIAARLVQRGVRVYEVPISYRARSREEGKKLTAVDGLRVVRTLLRCRLT